MKKSELDQIIREEIEAVITENFLKKKVLSPAYNYVKGKVKKYLKGKPKLGGPHVDKVMDAVSKMKPDEYRPTRKMLAKMANMAADNPNKPITLNISVINPNISKGIIKPGGDIPDIIGDMSGKFYFDDLRKLQKAVIAAEKKYLTSQGTTLRR